MNLMSQTVEPKSAVPLARPEPPAAPPPGAPAWKIPRCAGRPSVKAEVVLRLLRGEPLATLSRATAVPVPRLAEWRTHALLGLEQALHPRAADDPAQLRLDEANRRIGELSMEVELLRARCEKQGPFVARRSRP